MSNNIPLHFQVFCLARLKLVGVYRFSGDTQPTEVLVQAGKDANLLIHEATMADDQAELAKTKAHSTVGQAIDIGRKYVSPSTCNLCVHSSSMERPQDERGEDPSDTLFCSLPKDAPSNRRPGSQPNDSDQTSNSTFSIFAPILSFKLSHLRITG